jgi:hypothetical protein
VDTFMVPAAFKFSDRTRFAPTVINPSHALDMLKARAIKTARYGSLHRDRVPRGGYRLNF